MIAKGLPNDLAARVRKRALNRCEYCCLPQESQEARFHIDHIRPRALGGVTVLNNLALACVSCSLFKAAKVRVVDPQSQRRVAIFHPRRQHWDDHFQWTPTWRVAGKTPTGRATISALKMNRKTIVEIRRQLAAMGRLSPESDV
jgi:hypothetical protein